MASRVGSCADDPPLELDHRRRRVETELLAEHPTLLATRTQGLGLPARPDEGDDEVGPERLPQGMLADERLGRADHRCGPPAGQLGLEQPVVGDQS